MIFHKIKLTNFGKILTFFVFSNLIISDSYEYNSYNNHGVVGLINTPTARFFNNSVHGITFYDGYPPQKITLTSNPYDWLEASFFYTNIQDKPYPGYEYQDYKDKGFNFKLRIKEEGDFPALAIGINDIAGTGFFSSEYIVSSYGIGNFDFHYGLGWGTLNGSKSSFKNPLSYIYDGFKNRPTEYEDMGGQFQPSRYFSGAKVSPFYGITYVHNPKIVIKFEKDTTLTPGEVGYELPKSDYSYGLEYLINDNFSLGISFERGNSFSFKFNYKNNPFKSTKNYEYKKPKVTKNDTKYSKLRKNLENNGIGVNKIVESANYVGIELTQFIHPDIGIVEDIIKTATADAGIDKQIKKDVKVANLTVISEFGDNFDNGSQIMYQKKEFTGLNSSTNIKFRPFLASREEFFKGAILIENDSELILKDKFLFNLNLKYSLANNFDDFVYPPVDVYPAQVRSDIKNYLKNMDKGILIGRAQFDYHFTPIDNNHLMFTAGILEDMFSGYGAEYLYFKQSNNYAVGFEVFNVKKRDYKWRFGLQDYENTIGSINYYYRNYGYVPFDMKISYGEYLAGDVGSTIELSRTFKNGTKFGVFASFTDVTPEQFGEGTFDKGIFFNIPIYGNSINYTWRPLTKDPGAKLNRKHNLYNLLVKFQPISE